jgi:hypothetical protein
MPAQPRWLLHLPEIIDNLCALEAPVVDRAVVEALFGLRRRQAINLMHSFGGYEIGRTALIERCVLIARLREMVAGERFRFEQRRRERVAERLDELRRYRQAAAVAIRVESAADAGLPAGVRLEAGRLIIEFGSVEDLLAKLYGIAQAAAEDFTHFEATAKTGLGGS